MASRSPNNSGLVEAYLRIRELLEREGISVESDEPWHGPGLGTEEFSSLASATDLLVAGRQESVGASKIALWGAAATGNFGNTWEIDRQIFPQSSGRTAPVEQIVPERSIASPDFLWDEESAEAAVDCLFSFIHALELKNIEAAITCIAADYHAMDADNEVDRSALRIQLEAMIDRRRSGLLRIFLAEVPEPVFHPAGILLLVHIQVEHTPPSGLPESLTLSRVVVFNKTDATQWLISAMSPIL